MPHTDTATLERTDQLELRPVSTRSVLLSVLLGSHPPALSARELVDVGARVGIAEPTVRVALSRMVAAGDLLREGTSYTLSPRLLERQRRQDAVHVPEQCRWRGTWEMAVVTTVGRSAADRAALRTQLTAMRVAELREGVWVRPTNLRRPWPPELKAISTCFEARPVEDPVALARQLWDLDGWASRGRALLAAIPASDDPARRFTVVTAAVRHLLSDPMLPPELEPADWPGAALREAYDDYRTGLMAVRPTEEIA